MNRRFSVIFNEEPEQNYSIIDLVGELDSVNLAKVKDKINQFVDKHQKKYLVLNFLNLGFINSESISYILEIHETLKAKDQIMAIINAKQNVEDVLRVVGILNNINYYPNLVEFLKNRVA